MKRFFSAVCLCSVLLIAGLFFSSPKTEAENDVMTGLLALPAPPPPNPLMERKDGIRTEEFYDKKKPPKDDAPLEDLLDYWERQNNNYRELRYSPKPSPEVLERLLKEFEEHPEKISKYLNMLPADEKIAEKVKGLYDEELSNKKFGQGWQREIKQWLTYHSKYFSDKLLRIARTVKDQDEYINNQEELLALAKVDWDTARPLLDNMLLSMNQPVSQTLAKWAYYVHALDSGDVGEIERYREQLKAVIEDKNASNGMRDLAMDAIASTPEWSGRDDWYFGLMQDESLYELRINGRVFTGLTTIIINSEPEKYTKKMLELLKSDNPAVRSAAIRNLGEMLEEGDVEVIKALLPWLHDPKWAKDLSEARRSLVNALRKEKMPESVPGLIAVLNEKVVVQRPIYGSNSNIAPAVNSVRIAANSNIAYNAGIKGYQNEDTYPLRDAAIYSLATQEDVRAVPALRALLPQVDTYMRSSVVTTILKSGGFSTLEQLTAIEALIKAAKEQREKGVPGYPGYVGNAAVMAVNAAPVQGRSGANNVTELTIASSILANTGEYNPTVVPLILGGILIQGTEAGDDLVRAMVARIESLQRSDPETSAALKSILQRWRGKAVYMVALKELKAGTISLEWLVRLLAWRQFSKKEMTNEVFDARNGKPFARGIVSCMLEDQNEYEAILNGDNIESKTAMLGCARMVRAKLPLEKVAADLKSPNKLLATAAERYLESEDSPAARKIILDNFPGTMRILGARASFEPEEGTPGYDLLDMRVLFGSVREEESVPLNTTVTTNDEPFIEEEKRLKKELSENKDLLGIYYYNDSYIRVYADRAVFSWEEDVSRYWERTLKKEEFERFTSYVASNNIDGSPPYLSHCDYCEGKEFLMFGRAGGRRVFFLGETNSKLEKDLDTMFAEMRKPQAKLHYWLEKHVPGLEILYADDNLKAKTLWKNGNDLRLLIEDTPKLEKARQEMEENYYGGEDEEYEGAEEDAMAVEETPPDTAAATEENEESWEEKHDRIDRENKSWQSFTDGKLTGIISQPQGIEFLPVKDPLPVRATVMQWKARTPAFEIRTNYEWMYKVAGGQAVKFKEGQYSRPVVTPNGRWVIAVKNFDYQPQIVRINIAGKQEFPVNIPQQYRCEPVAYIPALNKVLLFAGAYPDYGGPDDEDGPGIIGKGNLYLLDADTGAVVDIRNDVRPLLQETFRRLQPAGTPDTFWAALPDPNKKHTQIGTFNTKTLLFKNLQTIPEIEFGSMDMWVDSAESKIYFTYEGHLLRLPLPKAGP